MVIFLVITPFGHYYHLLLLLLPTTDYYYYCNFYSGGERSRRSEKESTNGQVDSSPSDTIVIARRSCPFLLLFLGADPAQSPALTGSQCTFKHDL